MRAMHPVHQWLSIRVRLLCVLAFAVGSLLPPYVPKEALAAPNDLETTGSPQFLLVEDGFLMKSASLTRQGSRRAYAEGIIHTVVSGDTIQSVAQRYAISPDTVRWANNLTQGAALKAGQDLLILPVDGVIHTVAKGQNLSRIGELYNVPVGTIMAQNHLAGSYIVAGQELIVPGGKPIIDKPAVVATTPTPTTPAKPTTTPAKPTTPSGKPTQTVVATSGTLQMPCNNCLFTQYYHHGHAGVDIQTKGGGPIFAAEEGTVLRADTGWNGGYGNVIEVDHGNGVITLYGHNKELLVKAGDKVTRGQQIAWMGNTGRVYGATGIHIHFEVRVGGVKKNPLLYLQ